MKKGIGEFLKNERLEVGKTMEEVANFSGLSQPYISQIENEKRKPTVDTLARILIAISRNVTIDIDKTLLRKKDFYFNVKHDEYYHQLDMATSILKYLTDSEGSLLTEKLSINNLYENCIDDDDASQTKKIEQNTDLTPIIELSYKDIIYKLDGFPLTKEEFQALKTVLVGIIQLRNE